MTTILIIDDHPLVSDGIATMLKDVVYMRIIGTCKTGNEAIEFLSIESPDIILLDISLPDINGMELCTRIRKNNKTSKILGLTSANETGLITQLLSRGANGYLLKNMERDELISAIDHVLNGKTFLSKLANDKLLEQYNSLHAAMQISTVLTRREREILELLNDGLTSPQIADKLFLSIHTIDTHRKHLLQKLNAGSTQMLLKKAREMKMI